MMIGQIEMDEEVFKNVFERDVNAYLVDGINTALRYINQNRGSLCIIKVLEV
jgi:hypothetical protein